MDRTFRYYGIINGGQHVWATQNYWSIDEFFRLKWLKIEDIIFIIPGKEDDHRFYKCNNFYSQF